MANCLNTADLEWHCLNGYFQLFGRKVSPDNEKRVLLLIYLRKGTGILLTTGVSITLLSVCRSVLEDS